MLLLGADFPNTLEGTMAGTAKVPAVAAAVLFKKTLRFIFVVFLG
jgi:hypothetical protein